MASLARGEDFTDDLPVVVCFLAPMDPKRDKDVVVVAVAGCWTGANAEVEPTRRRTMKAVVADFMVVVLVLLNVNK
jgi:hypothetical protein